MDLIDKSPEASLPERRTDSEFQYERADWTLFRSVGTLPQKAGVEAKRLRRLVLKELADNALDAGGAVRVGPLDNTGDAFFVEDDGPGLDPDKVAYLFSINRPLVSSKILRLPTRGAMGNGLRVVVGSVAASDGALVVITRGKYIALRPQEEAPCPDAGGARRLLRPDHAGEPPHLRPVGDQRLRRHGMSGSVNKVVLIGNLGADPEIRRTQAGDAIANLRIATSETWRDKATGERKEKVEWHTVVIFNDGLVKVAEQYLRKGSKVYIQGALQTRSWDDQSGQKRYPTEIVLQKFRGELVMLDGPPAGQDRGRDDRDADRQQEDRGGYGSRQGSGYGSDKGRTSPGPQPGASSGSRDFDDDLPF